MCAGRCGTDCHTERSVRKRPQSLSPKVTHLPQQGYTSLKVPLPLGGIFSQTSTPSKVPGWEFWTKPKQAECPIGTMLNTVTPSPAPGSFNAMAPNA